MAGQHSPLPWDIYRTKRQTRTGGGTNHYIRDDNGVFVSMPIHDEANAAFIVLAVNHHARLVEALAKCETAIRRLAMRLDSEPGNQTAVAMWLMLADESRAALDAVEGVTHAV